MRYWAFNFATTRDHLQNIASEAARHVLLAIECKNEPTHVESSGLPYSVLELQPTASFVDARVHFFGLRKIREKRKEQSAGNGGDSFLHDLVAAARWKTDTSLCAPHSASNGKTVPP